MTSFISDRVAALEPSATMAMGAKAKELKAAGKKVYDFALGEPDFDTPDHIRTAGIAAISAGHTHYTAAPGIPELRQAVADQCHQRHGLEYGPAQVVISCGAKHALHNVFTATLNAGDEVIVPAPYWVSYAELVRIAGGVPVILQTEQSNDFKLLPEQLRAAVTDKTKILLICSPSNPTGSMYSAEELGLLADIVLEHDLLAIADEIYERLVYGDHRFTCFATVRPGLQDRTVIVNGVSKAYAMTGWRIGWTLSSPELAKAMSKLQSQETSNASSISQYAAVAALRGPQECVDRMRDEFAKRREFVQQRIEEIPGLSCPEMAGAFYAFINVKEHLGRSYNGKQVNDDTSWCLELLEQQNVATVMGSAFGTDGYARMSFAAAMDDIKAGFDRIEAFIKSSD